MATSHTSLTWTLQVEAEGGGDEDAEDEKDSPNER
jgi:hypothetical protein